MEPAREVRIARSTRDQSYLGQHAWEELSEESLLKSDEVKSELYFWHLFKLFTAQILQRGKE